jgi:hypothetical protein
MESVPHTSAMKGVDDLVVVEAGADHVRQFQEDWTLFFISKMVLDPTWTYRMFEWDKIIPLAPTAAAVDPAGKLEGLIAVDTVPAFLKVAFLSTAPWNHGNGKRRKGVGPALLSWAIYVSKRAGLGGALTLSSTPESETFYEQRGFVRTGAYDRENLAIFQLPANRSEKFLATNPTIPTLGAP